MGKSRFTLEPDRWYAGEFIWAEGNTDSRHHSPIKVETLKPRKDGTRSFDLAFYHANYTEGVRSKTYRLRTIERTGSFIFAERLDAGAKQILIIFPESVRWLSKHFRASIPEDQSPESWLERNC